MRIVKLLSVFFVITVLITSCATTQSGTSTSNSELLGNLSDKLSKGMVSRGVKKIAVVDFVDLEGRTTQLGKYLAEQLSVEMVNEEGISVVDRANISRILAEHQLTIEGLVNPDNAKELGKFAGIDAILIGTVTTVDGNIVLTVKAISTETAQIVAAAKTTIKNTSEFQQLSTRVTSPTQKSAMAAGETAAPRPSEPTEKPIHKAGPLIITLDSVRQSSQGVRVFFTVDSKIDSSLEVVKGMLIDSEGKEIEIYHSQRTDLNSDSKNQFIVVAEKQAGYGQNSSVNLKPPFDLSVDLGLAYGTVGAKTYSMSFHGLTSK